jgi:hypothetical protein
VEGLAVTPWDEKTRVGVGKVSLELPAALLKGGDAAIDSAANVFEAPGLSVTVDQGPFASRLGRPGYEEGDMDVGGTKGRTIFFRSAGGTTARRSSNGSTGEEPTSSGGSDRGRARKRSGS